MNNRVAATGPVPPWALAVVAMLSVQLASALSVNLISTVGPAATAWLRLSMGALIFLALARPPLRAIRRRDVPALLGTGRHHRAGDHRVPRRDRTHPARHRRRDRISRTVDRRRRTQPTGERSPGRRWPCSGSTCSPNPGRATSTPPALDSPPSPPSAGPPTSCSPNGSATGSPASADSRSPSPSPRSSPPSSASRKPPVISPSALSSSRLGWRSCTPYYRSRSS